MGTWGHGNLDSDYALDELSSRSHDLITEMLLRAQRPESREWDEYDYTTLFVELEIVFAFEAAKLLHTSPRWIPTPAVVRALAEDYITEWDGYGEDQGPGPERRKVILDTFERFAKICQAHEGEGGLPQPPKPVPPIAKQATPKATSSKAKPKATKAKPKKKR